MKTSLKMILLGLLLAQLGSCQNVPVTRNAQSSPSPSASVTTANKTVNAYLLPLQEHFHIAGFNTQDLTSDQQTLVAKAVTEFESDMANGNTESYFKSPDFSIKLLAGSEGSYFQSSELLTQLTNQAATFALALVVYADNTSDVFKGQLIDQTFYFDGAEGIPEQNTTYLVALDQNLAPQVFTGALKPFSIASVEASPTPTPTPSSIATPTPTPLAILPSGAVSENVGKIRQQLDKLKQQLDDYHQQTRGLRPAPPPQAPPGRQGQNPPPGQPLPPPGQMPPPPQGSGQGSGQGPGQGPADQPPPPQGSAPAGQNASAPRSGAPRAGTPVALLSSSLPAGGCPPAAGYVGPGRYLSPAELADIRVKRPEVAEALDTVKNLAPPQHADAVMTIYLANRDIMPELKGCQV